MMARGPIVVGVDGTPPSLEALRFAVGEAKKQRADDGLDLVVVHVRHLPWTLSSNTLAPMTETLDTLAFDTERAVKEELAGVMVTWRWVPREGDPAKELVRVANEHHARAIAVGGHRHGALTAALVHSVDASLVHTYGGTLFIVRPEAGDAEQVVPV
jgi:nucleotide-binding universal stress UspA family protein